jgi:hypothetical protein
LGLVLVKVFINLDVMMYGAAIAAQGGDEAMASHEPVFPCIHLYRGCIHLYLV